MAIHAMAYSASLLGEDGGIDGFRAVCLCGFEVRNSLSRDNVEADLAAHANYMETQARARDLKEKRLIFGA